MLVPLDGEIIPPDAPSRAAPVAPQAAQPAPRRSGTVLLAVVFASLLALAGAGSYYVWQQMQADDTAAAAMALVQHDLGTLEAKVATTDDTQSARQEEAIGALTKSVDMLKAELDAMRRASGAALAQANSKLDRLDQGAPTKGTDAGGRASKPDANSDKLVDMSARIDRIEHQVSSPAATGSIAPASRAAMPASVPPAEVASSVDKAASRPGTLANWILRDVYDGIALVEGRSGGMREIAPGEMLPGAGHVRSIERRGRAWIVVTSRGIIDDAAW